MSNLGLQHYKKVPPSFLENATPLKGFQLWLAENRDTLTGTDDSEISAKGLEKWKGLSREEKDSYKVPRVPDSSKRKRDSGAGDAPRKCAKIS